MKPELIVIGASWGGIRALQELLGALPPTFDIPIAIVQHRGRDASEGIAEVLGATCQLPVIEINDKDPIQPSRVYLAPADYHVLVDGMSFALSIEEPVSWARPSIDLLFDSAASSLGAAVIGVLLTGKGRDGVSGLEAIQRAGGRTIVQSPESAESDAMPRAAIEAKAATHVVPLGEIAETLLAIVQLERPRLVSGGAR